MNHKSQTRDSESEAQIGQNITHSIDEMFKPGESVQDYLQDIDQLVNNKISLGMKNMMKIVVDKIIVLIDQKVNNKVSEEF